MVNVIRIVKALISDKRGDDYTEKSHALTGAAKACIACGAIAAAAAGANTLSNNANSAGDTASQKVNAPVGAQSDQTTKGTAVYK